MLTKYTLLALAGLLETSRSQIHLWDVKASFEVIFNLQTLFHARCVFLIASDESLSAAGPRIALIQRRLSDSGVFTTLVGLEGLTSPQSCHANRPLNVIFDGEKEVLEYLGRLDRVPSHPRWVMFLAGDPTVALRAVNIEYDCEFLVVRAHAQDGHAVVDAVYRTQRQSPLLVEGFVEITPDGRHMQRGRVLSARRRDLHGVKIRVCLRNFPPLVSVIHAPGMPTRFEGFIGAVWKILEADLNFTSEFSESPTGQTSGLLDNGSWTGCIGAIQQKIADVTAADLTMTVDRTNLLDYLYPPFTTNNRYYIIEPTAVNLSWNNFLAPFAPRLWTAVGCSVALLTMALLVAHRCARRLCIEEVPAMDISQALVYMLGLTCGQGHETTPSAASGRIVYQVGALTGVVVLSAYAAALISFLTVETKEFPVQSFEDLLKADGRQKLGIRFGSGQFTLLETTADPVLRRLYDKLIQPTLNALPKTDQEGLLRVCADPKYGFITYFERTNGGKDLPCRIAPAPDIFLPARFAIGTAKGFPFRDVLNTQMLHLRHSGALRGLRWKFWPKTYPTEKSDFKSVTIEQSTPIIAVFVAGICLAVGLLVLERSTGLAKFKMCATKSNFKARKKMILEGKRFACLRIPDRKATLSEIKPSEYHN